MSASSSITTILNPSEGIFKDRGSKFFAYAYPVSDETQVREHLDRLKSEHIKARHFCYAYRIGAEPAAEFAQDAGEPAGSAGLPILNVLKSYSVTNTVILVVRFFGGTKLGIPGLINAYKQAAVDALEANKIVDRPITVDVVVKSDYKHLDLVYKAVDKFEGRILEQEINVTSEFNIRIPVKNRDQFKAECPPPIQVDDIAAQ